MDEETMNIFLENSTFFKDTISCGSLLLRRRGRIRGWEFPGSLGHKCSSSDRQGSVTANCSALNLVFKEEHSQGLPLCLPVSRK